MRVRPTVVDTGSGDVLQRSPDEGVAADKSKARLSAAIDNLAGQVQRRRTERGEGQLPRCEWCRWGAEVEAFHTRLIRCELNSQANVPQHSCGDFEREPGADDGK